MNYFFTADEHYGHTNIIKYCNRPFKDVNEMNEILIMNHNSIVRPDDITIHLGDFTLQNKSYANSIIKRLLGTHIFIKGSHDNWANDLPYIWEKNINGIYIVACHYPMIEWPRSFHGSIQLFGHVHGRIKRELTNQMDVGVDTNNFYPYSLKEILKTIRK